MKKGGLLNRDGIFLLIVVALFMLAYYQRFPLIEYFENLSYDANVGMTARPLGNADRIVILAIDDQSINRIGRWPWPRNYIASMVNKIAKARPKAIALYLGLDQAQLDPGLRHIEKMRNYIKQARFPSQARRQVRTLNKMLDSAKYDMDNDSKLARAFGRAGNVYIGMEFIPGQPKEDAKLATLPAYMGRGQLTRILGDKEDPPEPPLALPAQAVSLPLEGLAKKARGIGHVTLLPYQDGGLRSEALAIDYKGKLYASMNLLLAARGAGVSPKYIKVTPGSQIQFGKRVISTTPDMLMFNSFYRNQDKRPAFKQYSFYDLQSGKISTSVLRNKIVLLGTTAPILIQDTVNTPIDDAMPLVERHANVIASLLNQDYYSRPGWVVWIEFLLMLAVGAYLIVFMPGFISGFAVFLSTGLFFALIGGGHFLMLSEKIWLHTVAPAMLLLLGHSAYATRRYFSTAKVKRAAETDSAHSTRMLGLSFQAQGQLDMAMDKFRKLPVDKSVLELIYNLALDYERKRQFAKAGAAYDYIMEYDKRFRDVRDRKARMSKVEGTIIMGGGPMAAGGTMILTGGDHKPTLGRYEVEREIGRGAMGTVYLGSDPKINRVVAIKTLALTEEFEPHELDKVKERFFREAETAGRLSHPNIVTIYDAGEEHDLAYIAMEFLQGKDLTHYILGEELLPVDWVLDIIAHVADALDYAHKQEIVHRDIKPANIMYNEADDTVKVTDFGIARIVASSRTKTGVVLGTPSYMSPEQLAGKHVDGRSDLFSLGATMYELLTGKQPFTGDSMAALMYQITNKRHPDISQVRKKLAPCIKTIIDKALNKDPGKRFQSGMEFKQAIDRCLEKL